MKEYIDIDFVKPNKDCDLCDDINDYICFDHEEMQVREKYPNAKWELPEWYMESEVA